MLAYRCTVQEDQFFETQCSNKTYIRLSKLQSFCDWYILYKENNFNTETLR